MKEIDLLWPLSESYEYAAELGLGARLIDAERWQSFDSPSLRERLPLAQALGFSYLVHLEEEDPKWLRRILPLLIREGPERLRIELQASLECLGPPDLQPEPDPSGFPEPGRIRVIRPGELRAYSQRSSLLGEWSDEALGGGQVEVDWEPAGERDLVRVHFPEYIRGLRAMSGQGGGMLTPETEVFSDSWPACLGSAGAMISAARAARRGDPVLVSPATGSHHAERGRGGGTCLVNNLAAAAAAMLGERGISRVGIFDLDAHHGNGTEDIFYLRGDVMSVSVHQRGPFFPGTGAASMLGDGAGRGRNLNVEVEPGDSWAGAVREAAQAMAAFSPDLLLVEFSADAHEADPVSELQASDDDFCQAGHLIREIGAPVAVELGAASRPRAWGGALRGFLAGLLAP